MTTQHRCLGVVLWLILAGLPAARPVLGQQNEFLEVTFLNVGQGDAVLLRAPEGQTALVDTGWGGILSLLVQRDVRSIDLLVSSHPHADHIGGTAEVIEALPVRFYMDNGQSHTTATYQRLLGLLQTRSEITYLEAEPRTIRLGSAVIEVLPLPALGTVDHNNRSVTFHVRFGEFSVFLSGDSERRELGHLVSLGVVPDVTVLKAAHHGSDNGFTPEFLRLVRPEVVVISVGSNSYGHPRPEALAAYEAVADVYRTDQHGSVTIRGYRDGRYEVGPEQVSPRVVATPPVRPSVPPRPIEQPVTSLPGSMGDTHRVSVTVFPDAPGNDHANPNGEYVILQNDSAQTLQIGGWTLCDAARHCFRFPVGTMIPGGQGVVLFTGSGSSDGISFFMNSGAAVWNNDGDTASLFDGQGALVGQQTYE